MIFKRIIPDAYFFGPLCRNSWLYFKVISLPFKIQFCYSLSLGVSTLMLATSAKNVISLLHGGVKRCKVKYGIVLGIWFELSNAL